MLNALIPVFALIVFGGILRSLQFPGDGFWRGAERLTYYVLFPALLFLKLSTAETAALHLPGLAAMLVGMLLIVSAIIILAGYIFNIHGAAFTSLYQGGIRFNTYVGLAVVNGLLGEEGLATAAVVVGVMIPVINLLCIAVFAYAGNSVGNGLLSVARNIFTNPLIVACVLGILWNYLGWGVPDLLISVLELLSTTALPLGLLSVGAGVQITAIGNATSAFFISSTIKLLMVPALAYMLCVIAGQHHLITTVVVVFAALPTASSAYILARELGGDAPSMAAIITGQTLLAMVTLPLVMRYLIH
ncbi:MAG: AEC family transporter [Gammaproteobacteria bacterium]|nr:AEC family transporter [Gammaproteobacteria bacterium]